MKDFRRKTRLKSKSPYEGTSGADLLIYDAAGSLESTVTASFEQAVIDNEICGMVSRAVRGIEVSDRTLAMEVIAAVGPGGEFLSQRHTLENVQKEHKPIT